MSVADLISSLPNAVSGLASPVTSVLDSTGLSGIIADIDALLATPFVANIINSAVNTAAWYVNAAIPTAIFLANALNSGAPVAIAEGAIEAAEGAASAAAAGLADSVTPAGLGASLGEATLVAGCQCRRPGLRPHRRQPPAPQRSKAAAGPSPPKKPAQLPG